jgi:hypothetical protein
LGVNGQELEDDLVASLGEKGGGWTEEEEEDEEAED